MAPIEWFINRSMMFGTTSISASDTRRIAIRNNTKSFATKNKFSKSAPEVTSGSGKN
jgi:hypothetical protein